MTADNDTRLARVVAAELKYVRALQALRMKRLTEGKRRRMLDNIAIWCGMRRLLLLARLGVVLLVVCTPCFADLPDFRIELVNCKVVDADTITADCILGFDVVLLKQTIRCSDFDAYESSRARRTVGTITAEELAKGREAKAELIKLIAESKTVWVMPQKRRDAYGRRLGRVFIDSKPLAEWATARGYVRPKEPKAKAKP